MIRTLALAAILVAIPAAANAQEPSDAQACGLRVEDALTITGQGSMNSQPIMLDAGDYVLTTDTGASAWYGDLDRTDGESTFISFPGSGQESWAYGVEEGTYYVSVQATSGDEWSVTITPA